MHAPIGINWVDNGNGQWCITDLSEGIYSVAVIDENGCEPINEIQNIILTTPTSISVDFNSSIEVDCENNIITQTNFIFIDGGQPPYEITWSCFEGDVSASLDATWIEYINRLIGALSRNCYFFSAS